jgi:hypothetical protein
MNITSTYRDGGIEVNNPAMEAIALAAKFQKDINVVVSIGTGKRLHYFDELDEKDSIFRYPLKVIDWLTETESTHSKAESACSSRPVHYFRFQPPLSSKLLKMNLTQDEVGYLKTAVQEYLKQTKVQNEMKRLVKKLSKSNSKQ